MAKFTISYDEYSAINDYINFLETSSDPCKHCSQDKTTCTGCPPHNEYSKKEKEFLDKIPKNKAVEDFIKAHFDYKKSIEKFQEYSLAMENYKKTLDEAKSNMIIDFSL